MRPADFSAAALREAEELSLAAFGQGRDGSEGTLEAMEQAVDAIVAIEEYNRVWPMQAFAHALHRMENEEQEQEAAGGSRADVKTMAGALLVVGKTYVKRMALWTIRFGKNLVFTMGRILIQDLLIPVVTTVVRGLVATPVGAAILASGALAYFIYRTVFKKESPPANAIGTPGARSDGSLDWDDMGRQYLGRPLDTWAASSVEARSASGQPMGATATARTTEEQINLGKQILATKRSQQVKDAIGEAARRVGVDSGVLTAFAYKESSFQVIASPGTSSAQGLFQFLNKTWAYTVGKYGEMYGVPANASRNDPLASAIMGAAYLKHEIYPVISKVVPQPSATDLYFGHFMGPGNGPKFLRNMQSNPNRYAYLDFGEAAAANSWVYFHDGKQMSRPKTYAEIYATFAGTLNMIQAAHNATEGTTTNSATAPSTGAPIIGPPPPSIAAKPEADSLVTGPPSNTNTPYRSSEYYMGPNSTVVQVPNP